MANWLSPPLRKGGQGGAGDVAMECHKSKPARLNAELCDRIRIAGFWEQKMTSSGALGIPKVSWLVLATVVIVVGVAELHWLIPTCRIIGP